MDRNAVLFFITLLIPPTPAIAQERGGATNPGVYKVEFNIHDAVNASPETTRRYVMMIEADGRGDFRVGQKVPYATAALHSVSGAGAQPLVPTQFNFAEVGVNIDCSLKELEGKVRLKAQLDLSTISQYEKSDATALPMPIIGQLKADVNALVTPGKSTVVASIDDPVAKRKFDVETTVTKVN